MSLLKSFFQSDKTSGLIKEIGDMGDKLFTSDEEKKQFAAKMEALAASSNNVVVKTARSSLIWAIGIIAVYHMVVRDMIALYLGRDLPKSPFDIEDLLEQVFKIIAGTL